jgi:hypothetical protein
VAIGDLNGDGRPDLVTANSGSAPTYHPTISLLLGNGDGTFAPTTDLSPGGIPGSVTIADLNEDGKPDLVIAFLGIPAVFLGNGDGTFGPRIDLGTHHGTTFVAVADLNGDGKLDLASVGNYYGSISIQLGNGDATFGQRIDYGVAYDPEALAIADLNGDGRPDIAVANGLSNTVSVLVNTGGVPWLGVPPGVTGRELLSARVHPVPARGALTLDFALPHASDAMVRVYDTTGRLVRMLARRTFAAGEHAVRWDRLNAEGRPAPAGVYFIDVRTADAHVTRRAVLLE